jgi:hypothetical protein
MTEKTKKIIYWVLTGLVAFVFLGSAMGKLTGAKEGVEMALNFGFDKQMYFMIGVVELVSVVLFVLPRTGILGSLLLVAFLGGAIATHLQHGESIVAPCIIEAFVLLVSFYRFPELISRLLKSNQ